MLAGIAVALTVGVWLSARHSTQPTQPPIPAALSPAILESAWQTAAAPPEPRDLAAPGAAQSAVAEAKDAVEMEICGFGMVNFSADDGPPLQRMAPSARNAALDPVDALMLASDDERVRAAALLIGARSRREQARERTDRLARLAVGSRDPAVYAMALEACTDWVAADGGACPLLTRAQWVRLDPGDVLPWLELAAEAHQRNDADAEAEAMRLAALARRSEAYEGLLPELVERALGRQVPAVQRRLALGLSWNAQTVWALSRSRHALAHCTRDAAMDADRQQTCDAIAKTLAQQHLSLAELGLGLAIGKNPGWSVERLQALQQLNDAISELSGLQTIGLDLGCDSVARIQDWLLQLGARGQGPALRAVLAGGGGSAAATAALPR